jgi:hypothetical protein
MQQNLEKVEFLFHFLFYFLAVPLREEGSRGRKKKLFIWDWIMVNKLIASTQNVERTQQSTKKLNSPPRADSPSPEVQPEVWLTARAQSDSLKINIQGRN